LCAVLLPLLLWSAAMAPALAAQVVGTVSQLSGPLLARRADGSTKVLALRSEVQEGDTLVTEKNTYALLKLIDNSEITLKPDSTFTIDKFSFEGGKPENDSAAFNLVRGGLRSVTGLLGKRSKERFGLKTPTATIGIRGTTFIVQYVAPPSMSAGGPMAPVAPAAQAAPPLAPGLYVQVTDGQIVVSNQGGTANFAAGQFGYTPNFQQAPVIIPSNPGIQFTPPPAFSAPAGSSSASTTAKSGEVDCIVR
jgi:hypothetical protein